MGDESYNSEFDNKVRRKMKKKIKTTTVLVYLYPQQPTIIVSTINSLETESNEGKSKAKEAEREI